MKLFAVVYAALTLFMIVVQVWLCVVSPPFILVAWFTIGWGIFFALALLSATLESKQP